MAYTVACDNIIPYVIFRFHELSHAHASVLLENLKGEDDILKVSKRLGHSGVATTRNIYAHILGKSETEVVGVLDRLF